MKKLFNIILLVVIIVSISGYYFWQKYKHQIVKDLIATSVNTLTSSLYSLQYDSSMIDEINGEVYFENILLKTDSLQLQSLKLANHLPAVLIEISIKSIAAQGLDLALAIDKKKLVAKKIIINEPHITITSTGEKALKKEDSIALFKKILGNYNSIHAESIEIINAKFTYKNSDEPVNTQLTKLNISFNNIVVDSTKDYRNVICYFINNMKANAEQLYINQPNRNYAIVFDKIKYNAAEKNISIDNISTLKEGKNEERFVINAVKLDDLNIEDFVNKNTINVGNISTGECMLTLFINKKDPGKTGLIKTKKIDFPDDYFDKIKIGGISIGKSTLIIKSRTNGNKPPIRVNGFEFHLSKDMKINKRSTLRSILDNAKWNMQVDNFAIKSNDNKYDISVKGLSVDKASTSAFIHSLKVKPSINETLMSKESLYQQDIYDIDMKAIHLSGWDINKFINESALSILEVSLNLDLKVFHDRVPALPLESKVGNYPHQLLLKSELPIYIRKIVIKNSLARYCERSKETKLLGDIVFTNIEAEINNVTNNALMIEKNPICKLKMNGILLEKGKCSTNCRLFLNSQKGQFELDGFIGTMNFNGFNSLIKPLALTTIEGQLNSLQFAMAGNDREVHGNMLILYRDLKFASYRLEAETYLLEEKKSKTMVSNLFAKNSNPSNGNTRFAKLSAQRDIRKSFFNLIWKGVYDGIQNTILNKKVAELKKQMKETK